MNVLQAAILGLVEGITEYLPVSSTGHLILTASLLGLGGAGGAEAGTALAVGGAAASGAAAAGGGADLAAIKESFDRFEIVIQGGAILAVAGLYWPRIRQMARGVVEALMRGGAGRASPRGRAGLMLLRNLFISFLPAAIIGLALEKTVKAKLFHPIPVIAALLIGGVVLLLLGPWQRRVRQVHEHEHRDPLPDLSAMQALVIGFAQALAIWPGTSRSLVTILGGMFIGLGPRRAAEYSFLLGLPTLGAATAWQLLHVLRGEKAPDGSVIMPGGWQGVQMTVDHLGGWAPVLVGLIVAAVSAALTIKFLVGWLGRHSLVIFGWWRILVAGAFAWAIVLGWIAR